MCIGGVVTPDHAALLRFEHVAGGLVARDGALRTFEIAGADGAFIEAEATIQDGHIAVRAPGITEPAAVRYAWANYPAGCNLFNGSGLPAAPFTIQLSKP